MRPRPRFAVVFFGNDRPWESRRSLGWMMESSPTFRSKRSRFSIDCIDDISAFGVEKRSGEEAWKSEGESRVSSSWPLSSPRMRRLTFDAKENDRDIIRKDDISQKWATYLFIYLLVGRMRSREEGED